MTVGRKNNPVIENEWVKLADAEIQKLENAAWVMYQTIRKFDTMKFARSIEELSKEKNHKQGTESVGKDKPDLSPA